LRGERFHFVRHEAVARIIERGFFWRGLTMSACGMTNEEQQDLFGATPGSAPSTSAAPTWPAREILKEELAALAKRGVFLGTSSWKYERWLGQLYTANF
jgi:hypothetical protein